MTFSGMGNGGIYEGSYLLSRICMKTSSFEEHENSTAKTVAACVLLAAVIGIYFL